MTDTVYTKPKLTGVMRESTSYSNMGLGLTDRVMLLGHADGISLYDMKLVLNLQSTVNDLDADTSSPLLRSLFETYYSGARDIWIMAVAPMEEYVADPSERLTAGAGRGTTSYTNLGIADLYTMVNRLRDIRSVPHLVAPSSAAWDGYNFYQRYYKRLELAYEVLMHQDIPQLLTPVEALFNGTGATDFLAQLAEHCGDALLYSGAIRMGFLGTRSDVLNNNANTVVTTTANDNRLDVSGDSRKFVSIVYGEASMNMKEFPTSYTAPAVTAAMGILSNLPISRGIIYQPMPVVIAPVGGDLTAAQITTLTERKLNPIIRTTRGKRGEPFQTVVVTDNTLGTTGTDFWSMGQVRLLMHIIDQVRALSGQYIGTIEYGEYKRKVQRYMVGLVSQSHIRGFNLNISKAPDDPNQLLVDISVQPYLGLRQLTFITTVGPGA